MTASDTTSEVAIGGGLAYGGEVGIGASVALNEITQHTRAIIEPLTVGGTTINISLTIAGNYTQTATDGVDVIAVGLSAGVGQSAVASTIAINLGTTSAEATVTDATITTTGPDPVSDPGDVVISAVDTSTIDSGVGALALGVLQPSKDPNSSGNSGSTHLAIGISIGFNSIDQQVPVTVTGTTIAASGQVELTASATGTIYTVGVAGGGTFNGSGSSSSSGGFQLPAPAW